MGALKSARVGLSQDPEVLRFLWGSANWKKLAAVARIRSQRQIGDKISCEDRFYIASISGAKPVLLAVRSHWGIENRLHWVLDIAFDEDHYRLRKEHGPENFAVLRHIALNLLKQETSLKRSIKGKRLFVGWNQDYLLKLLSGFNSLVQT